jgi:ribosomal protein S18 acetylase RimI-like enzyme
VLDPDRASARAYRSTDRAACMAVFDSNVPVYFLAEERALFTDFLDALPGPYLVMENSDGGIVACGGWALDEGGARADLCWGMVHASVQGRGWGRRLTRLRIEGARHEPGIREIALSTTQRTEGFYLRFGFRTRRTVPDGYGPGLDRCEMRLAFDP